MSRPKLLSDLSDVMQHLRENPIAKGQLSSEEYKNLASAFVVRPKGINLPFVLYARNKLTDFPSSSLAHELKYAKNDNPQGLEVIFLNGIGDRLGSAGSITVNSENMVMVAWKDQDRKNRIIRIPDENLVRLDKKRTRAATKFYHAFDDTDTRIDGNIIESKSEWNKNGDIWTLSLFVDDGVCYLQKDLVLEFAHKDHDIMYAQYDGTDLLKFDSDPIQASECVKHSPESSPEP